MEYRNLSKPMDLNPQILRPFRLLVADFALKTKLSAARLCRAKREGSKTVHSSQPHCKKQRICFFAV